jgi:hypothetical protein
MSYSRPTRIAALGITALSLTAPLARADFVINDDLIVDGSACIGFDCVNGEVFGFDTLRLKENNLRIKFDDTSTAASYPRNDWQITANDSANGGQSKFSIDDITGNRTPFTIEANARSHSLYVDDGGRIGIRTSTPSVELHIIDGDTPTVRLQQDGSSGFAPQTWDMAGNETNFFVRDVTNGSQLPFRIRPDAPTNSIFIEATGDIGVGTSSPVADMHVRRTTQSTTEPTLLIENTGTTANGNSAANLQITDLDGRTRIAFNDGSVGDDLTMELRDTQDDFLISFSGTGANELTIKKNGRVLVGNGDLEVLNGDLEVVAGDVVVGGTTLNVPDYVFDDDYDLMPLNQLGAFVTANKHLPNIPSAADVNAGRLNMTQMQLALLEKVEELTLYTLDQDRTIGDMNARLARQDAEIETLRRALAAD